jgi:membrane fusion protein, multidrug efflux system
MKLLQPFANFALIAAVALLMGCSDGVPSESSGSDAKEAAKAEVTVTHVTRSEIQEVVTVSGTVAALPNYDVRVSSLVPGRIAEMKVAEGDSVKAGEVIAQLDARSLHDQLLQAEAGEAQAKANLENAQASKKRNEDLFHRGIASRKDSEDATTQESVAAASLKQAEAGLSIARMQLDRTQIRSPLTGKVAKRFVSVGEQVDGTAAQPVAEVAELSEVELLGNLPAMYLAKLRVGESLAIESDAFSAKELSGRVVAISPAVDAATNVGLIRIRIPNSDGVLRLGMYLTAEIGVEKHPNALTLPPEAVYRDEKGEPHVYRVEQNKATAADVKLGIQTKARVEILSGVNEGDTVILTGGYGLPDQADVQIKP